MRFMSDQAGRLPRGWPGGSDFLREEMKRLLAMFVLTPREQRLVIFVVLTLVVGVSIKHQRDKRVDDLPRSSAAPLLPAVVSPTPNLR